MKSLLKSLIKARGNQRDTRQPQESAKKNILRYLKIFFNGLRRTATVRTI